MAQPPMHVGMTGISKTYDGHSFIVRDLNLDIAKGESLTLLGPSGSGKTTTLMMLAGFEFPSAGEIMLDGRPIQDKSPEKRNIGMVFQNYALFPHMTVAENVGYSLRVRGSSRAEISTRVGEALAMVQLSNLAQRKPSALPAAIDVDRLSGDVPTGMSVGLMAALFLIMSVSIRAGARTLAAMPSLARAFA